MRSRTTRVVLGVVALVAAALVGPVAGAVPAVASAPPAAAAPSARTWTVTDRLGLSADTVATACRSADCWAVTGGKLLHSADVGARWSDRTASVPADVLGLGDVACPSTRCVVTAYTGAGAELLLLDGGDVAERPVAGAAAGPLRLACATAQRCLLTDGTTAFRTGDAGATWASKPLPTRVLAPAVSCVPGGLVCVVGGSVGEFDPVPVAYRSHDGGRTWERLTFPDHSRRETRVDDVVCSTAALCRLSGYAGVHGMVVETTSATDTATVGVDLPGTVYEVFSLSCVSATTCTGYAASTTSGQRDLTTTDGVHWRSAPVDTAYLSTSVDVACAPDNRCLAAVPGAVRARGADRAWHTVTVPAALRFVVTVSCANVAPCVGVGYDAANRPVVLRGRPGSWSVNRMPAGVDSVQDVDCATPAVCTALTQFHQPDDPATYRRAWRTTDAGVTWTPRPLPSPTTGFNRALDCPTVTTCLALGFTRVYEPDLLRTVDSGVTWTRVAAPSGARDLGALSCAGPVSCVLVGHVRFDSPLVTWRTADSGATFSGPTRVGLTSGTVSALACRATSCAGVGWSGSGPALVRSTDRGRTWTTSAGPVEGLTSLSGLACSTGGRCATLGTVRGSSSRPLVSPDGGATWQPGSFSGATPGGEVACLDTGCFATGYDGGNRPVVLAEPL